MGKNRRRPRRKGAPYFLKKEIIFLGKSRRRPRRKGAPYFFLKKEGHIFGQKTLKIQLFFGEINLPGFGAEIEAIALELIN